MEFKPFDAEYVHRLIAGDRETQDDFAHYFNELLLIKLRSRLRSMEEVHDVRQETLARVLQALGKGALQQPERLGAFVNSVCNNVLLEHYRKGGRTVPLDAATEPVSPAAHPDSALITSEREAKAEQILASLPKRDRSVLQAIIEEKDKDQICSEFGVTRTYLRVLLHRAVESARRQAGVSVAQSRRNK